MTEKTNDWKTTTFLGKEQFSKTLDKIENKKIQREFGWESLKGVQIELWTKTSAYNKENILKD